MLLAVRAVPIRKKPLAVAVCVDTRICVFQHERTYMVLLAVVAPEATVREPTRSRFGESAKPLQWTESYSTQGVDNDDANTQ